MDQVTDIKLPDFLDPLLSYLSDTLPHPLYSFLLSLLAHSLALTTALFSLLTSLITTSPLEWDAQTVLPPLISILAAYLAILSLYRTTSWMIRASMWFVKWGAIFGALIGGAGWYMGNRNGVGGYGVVAGVVGLVLDVINGQGQNAVGGSRARPRPQSSHKRARASGGNKPKPWESFERHRQWQYRENEVGGGNEDVQKVIGSIIGAAGGFVKDSRWWEAAKNIVAGEQEEREGSGRKATTKARTSGSR
jgi:hypothetical protein